jgi:DNA-binding MarR family transcriptional regulator
MIVVPREADQIADLALAIGLLVRRIRAATPSELSELSWTQKAVMARLEREGPATTADLARAESVKPQSMGAAVAALEALELVERKPHPTDGRQFHIQLTKRGAAMRKAATSAKHTWLAQAIAKLDKHERDMLFAAGDVIRRLVDT